MPFSPCEAMDAIHGQCCRSSCGGSRHFPFPSSELKWIFKQLHLTLPFLLFFPFLFLLGANQSAHLHCSPGLAAQAVLPVTGSWQRAERAVMSTRRCVGRVDSARQHRPCKRKGAFWTASSVEIHAAGLVCKYSI